MKSRSILIALSALFFVISVFLVVINSHETPNTDYALELNTLNKKINLVAYTYKQNPNFNLLHELIFLHYSRVSLTAQLQDYRHTEILLDKAITHYPKAKQLNNYKAYLDFHLHKFDSAKNYLAKSKQLANETFNSHALQADIALQQGDYDRAGELYATLLAQQPTWDNLARIAYYYAHTGKPDKADDLYQSAQTDLTVKQMRTYAWLELQRGILDLEQNQYQQALVHYQKANKAFSGFWLIEEHIAEVLALLGEYKQAIRLYETVLTKTDKPELIAALANLLEDIDEEEATQLHQKAQQKFDQIHQLYPQAIAGHLIEYLLQKNTVHSQLLKYAKYNNLQTPNIDSQLLLIKAYIKNKQTEEASALLKKMSNSLWRQNEINALLQQLKQIAVKTTLPCYYQHMHTPLHY